MRETLSFHRGKQSSVERKREEKKEEKVEGFGRVCVFKDEMTVFGGWVFTFPSLS